MTPPALLSGNLPGRVYGRPCDCVHVTDPALAPLVTAAAGCASSLAGTLIVSSRPTALAVLDYLRTARAGCLKCIIVDEASGTARELPRAWRDDPAVVALAQGVAANAGCEAALPVVRGLLSGWVGVADWATALRCSEQQAKSGGRFGIVTRCVTSAGLLLVCLSSFRVLRVDICSSEQSDIRGSSAFRALEIIKPSCEVSRSASSTRPVPFALPCKASDRQALHQASGDDAGAAEVRLALQRSCAAQRRGVRGGGVSWICDSCAVTSKRC